MQFFIYSRKSVYTGRGDSIENQIEMCRQYIISKYPETMAENITIYEDEGFSGKNMRRPQFQRMLRDISKLKPNFIVCYRLDRISRSVSDFSALVERLNRDGISFLCIKEEFDTSKPMGKAMLYIASVFAQLERETIAERVRDNMLLLARSGRWLGGTSPLGFQSQQESQMIVDGGIKTLCQLCQLPHEIEIIQLIFKQFLLIKSLSGLEKYLHQKQITTRSGAHFSRLSLKEILRNPVYAAADSDSFYYFESNHADITFTAQDCCPNHGLMVYNKRDYTQKNIPRNPISRWIVAIGHHSATISGGDWVAVQHILEQKLASSSPKISHQNDYSLLSGLLRCPRCHSPMYAKNRWKQEGFDYICQKKLLGGSGQCGCQNLSGTVTDEMIYHQLLPYIALNGTQAKHPFTKTKSKNVVVFPSPLELTTTEKRSLISSLVKEIHWKNGVLTIYLRQSIAPRMEVDSLPSSPY